jgi:hypothetical protein
MPSSIALFNLSAMSFPLSPADLDLPEAASGAAESLQTAPANSDSNDAPLWFSRSAFYFRIGLALFLALSCLLGLGGCTQGANGWKQATQIFSVDQVRTLLIENSTVMQPTNEQVALVRVMLLDSVAAVDFHQPELCGNRGCLYGLYHRETFAPLLQTYLQPALPPNVPLFEADGQSSNGFPCLHIHQIDGGTLKRSLLCVVDDRYRVTNQVDRAVAL